MSGLGSLPDKFTIALPLHSDYSGCTSDGDYIYINYREFDDASNPLPKTFYPPYLYFSNVNRQLKVLGGTIFLNGDVKLPISDVKEILDRGSYPCTRIIEKRVMKLFRVEEKVNTMCTSEFVKYVATYSNKYLTATLQTERKELIGEVRKTYEEDPIRLRKETLKEWWPTCDINGYWLFRAEKLVSPSGRFVRVNTEPMTIGDIENAKPDYVLVDVVVPDRDVNYNYYDVDVQLDGGSALIEVLRVRHWWKYDWHMGYSIYNTFYGNYHILILAKFGSRFFTRAWFEDHYVFDYEIDTSTIPPTIRKL